MNRLLQVVSALVCLAAIAEMAVLTEDQHMLMQDVCGSIPHFTPLGNLDDKVKTELTPHMKTVCKIYERIRLKELANKKPSKRNILEGLSGLVGKNSKLSTLLKAAEALNKAKTVFDDIKSIAPDVHQHLQDGIKDVHDSFHDLIDSIANQYLDDKNKVTATPKSS